MLDEKIVSMKDEIIRGVQGSIRIKSTEADEKDGKPFGEGIHEALEHCLKLSEELGFKAVNVDNMAGYAEYGQGEEMVAVLGHLDVVPEGSGWTYPPYGGEIHDGKLYGRGAIDDKGPTIGALYALKAIKELNLQLRRRVRVIFGLNEEAGSKCIKYYVDHGGEIPVAGFTPDGAYPIINGEKGIVTCRYRRKLTRAGNAVIVSIKGGTVVNAVPDYAEAVFSMPEEMKEAAGKLAEGISHIKLEDKEGLFIISSYGVSAHGSTPEKGRNAISQLLLFLGRLDLGGDAGEFVDFMNRYVGHEVNGESLGIFMEDDVSGKFTFNLGKIDGTGEEIVIGINMRYPVTKTYEEFIGTFEEKMRLGKMEQVSHVHKKRLYVAPESELIKKLSRVYEEKTGEKAELLSIGGGTYAKAIDNIVAFGPIFPGQPVVEHMPDEYIEVDSLIKNVQIMAAAMYELAK
ncbi:MAG: dipeptidase PepV [Pseudomonadota bacterium]